MGRRKARPRIERLRWDFESGHCNGVDAGPIPPACRTPVRRRWKARNFIGALPVQNCASFSTYATTLGRRELFERVGGAEHCQRGLVTSAPSSTGEPSAETIEHRFRRLTLAVCGRLQRSPARVRRRVARRRTRAATAPPGPLHRGVMHADATPPKLLQPRAALPMNLAPLNGEMPPKMQTETPPRQ